MDNMMFKSANLEDISNWAANHPIAVSAILGGALGGIDGAVDPADGNKLKRARNVLFGAAGGAGIGALGSAATMALMRPAKYEQVFRDALENVLRDRQDRGS